MNTAILITLIICGTIVLVTILGLLFTMWVITKGITMSERK
ncbi:MAG: hypothetical protein PHH14_06285 [Candidatus Margulisbacteria bacterium]|nr:hypothetical protein [Candidatus Margulisiibacteriota bacterium]